MEIPEQVLLFVQHLHKTHNITKLCVAYSGGMDSHVLLQSISLILTRVPHLTVRAIYVNHGLNREASKWAKHCAEVCRELMLDFSVLNVEVKLKSGDSLEAVAREARYAALRSALHSHECLLTAQHQDDQAETLLLQLLRGSGPQGLASMPEFTLFAKGYIARPFLAFTREQIGVYASESNLHWVDDGSNEDLAFSRNYLRHEVIPILKKRWPAFSKTVSRSAQLCAEAQRIIEKNTQSGMERVLLDKQNLSVSALIAIDEIQRKNIIRDWIKTCGLPSPTRAGIQQIEKTVLFASHTATPLTTWPGCEVRRYQDRLYAMSPLEQHDPELQLSWDLASNLQSDVFGMILVKQTRGQGINHSIAQSKNIKIAFRQGGECYCEYSKAGTRTVKKLFQEMSIPPWLRGRIPLIYVDNHLIAIADMVVCSAYKAKPHELGATIIWKPAWPI